MRLRRRRGWTLPPRTGVRRAEEIVLMRGVSFHCLPAATRKRFHVKARTRWQVLLSWCVPQYRALGFIGR